MTQRQEDTRIVGEIIDAMADRALRDGEHVNLAVERFSSSIDRLLKWIPADLRVEALERARAHGYCTEDQIERLRQEITIRH